MSKIEKKIFNLKDNIMIKQNNLNLVFDIKAILLYSFFTVLSIAPTFSQKSLLQSGPMLGPITLTDATLWIQTKGEANVHFGYREKGSAAKYELTPKKMTKADDGFAASLHVGKLKPQTAYEYQAYINNIPLKFEYPLEFKTHTLWRYRTDAPDFTFVAGSCFYVNDPIFDRPGKPYGGEHEIVDEIVKTKPDFMVWLGDNIYLREGDFESRSGIYYRNTHTRAFPKLQPLLSSTPHYAIWDDHDFGPNDSDWTYPLKQHSRDAFHDFWPSESYGVGGTEGVTNGFEWNDCQFFMLDDRWYRTVDRENGTVLGDVQKYWLKESLLSSRASFKFICTGGQFLSDAKVFENVANYPHEREEIIQFLDDNNIKGVVFITGDRHHSEISKMTTAKGNTFYDVTSSAMTSGTGVHNEPNTLHVKGSMIGVRNFAHFKVSGNMKNRKLSVVFKNSKGEDIYAYDFEK